VVLSQLIDQRTGQNKVKESIYFTNRFGERRLLPCTPSQKDGEHFGLRNQRSEKQVKFIRSSAQDLMDLVNDLLDLAKVEAGKVTIRPTHFTINSLFSALRGMLRPLLQQNSSVRLVFDDLEQDVEIYSDEAKVSQILRNFISNALKFT